jgi:hypothetical protein
MREREQMEIPEWFGTQVLGLGLIYPSSKIERQHVAAWWVHLHDIEREHIAVGLAAATRDSPMYCPTAEQVRARAVESRKLAAKRAEHERAEQMADRMLPEHELRSRDELVQAFYRACDLARSSMGPRKLTEADELIIAGIIALALRYLGCTRDDGTEQFARWVLSDCQHRGHQADAVLAGLRKIIRVCTRPPTLGMIEKLIRGQDISWEVGELERKSEPPIDGAYEHVSESNPASGLVTRWQDDSHELGIGPGESIPPEMAAVRFAEIQALLGDYVL